MADTETLKLSAPSRQPRLAGAFSPASPIRDWKNQHNISSSTVGPVAASKPASLLLVGFSGQATQLSQHIQIEIASWAHTNDKTRDGGQGI